jgi:hypothetical protein
VSPKETSAEGATQVDEIFSINLHPGQLDTIWRENFFPYFRTLPGAPKGAGISLTRTADVFDGRKDTPHSV